MLSSVSRRHVLAALAAAPLAAAPKAFAASDVNKVDTSLSQAARDAGRFYGTAAQIGQIEADPALKAAILRDCSCVTPEFHFNWESIRHHEDSYWFEPADGLVAFAASHGLRLRGHSLLWEQGTPGWAKNRLARDKDWGLVETFFKAILPRYEGRVAEWDVVNEPIDTEQGRDGLRTTTFYKAFGPDYIPRAMREARRYDRKAKLFINEYGFDYDNPVEERRRTRFLKLVERLKADGVPLDGVGVQAHLELSKGPFKPVVVRDFLKELRDLGLDIVITELDVKEQDKSAPLPLRDRRVAAEAAAYLDTALDEPAVKGVVTWGLSDRHSWLQDQSRGLPSPRDAARLNRGLPYDAALARKDMYFAIRDAFLRA